MYQTILFDLDGTLTDSAPGIIRSVQYALKKYGMTEADENLRKFIGPPLIHSFQKFYGFDHDKAMEAVKYYREYFASGGMFENSVYPGITGMLEDLKKAGKQLLVVTSKPEPYAKQIVEHFDLADYFDAVCGAAMDETRTKKVEVLAYALSARNIDPKTAVMIGDREDDVLAAGALGVDCIGVLYGYGSREELEAVGARTFAGSPEDISRIVTES